MEYTMTTNKELQMKREAIAALQGQDAFELILKQSVDKQREADTSYGLKLIAEVYETTKPLLKHYIETQITLRRKSSIYLNLFKQAIEEKDIDAVVNTVAFLFAQSIINRYSNRSYLTSTASKLLKGMKRSLQVEVNDEHTKGLMTGAVQLIRHFIDGVDWLELKAESYTAGNGQNYIEVSEEKRIEASEFNARLTANQVFHKPMVCKPLRHTNLVSMKGGYLTHRSPLMKRPVKIDGVIHPYITGFKDKAFFDLINAHQEVGYKINQSLLSALPVLIEAGVQVDGLHYDVEALFATMQDDIAQEINDKNNNAIESFGEDAYILTEGQIKSITKGYYIDAKQQVNNFFNTVNIATEYAEFNEFYYPIFLDNRARVYYYAKYLNPQGSELHKALLQFSEGAVMNDESIIESLFAFGNALGLDKKVEKVRLDGANALLPVIMRGDVVEIVSHLDPEQALTGLAIALDIKGYYDAKARGEAYTTHQPLHVDSCNSGSQLNGLLLLDKKNCTLSNILNTETDDLYDTYLEVAKGLHETMKADTSGVFKPFLDNPQIFERKVFKLSSMTRSNYGASYLTCSGDIKIQMKARHREFWNSISTAHKKVFINAAIKEVDASLPASNNYKKFANALIKAAVKRDGVLAFHSPCNGFPVVLRENVEEIQMVSYREMLTGKRKTYNFKTYTNELNATRSVTSGVPSITHHMDSAVIISVKAKCGDIPMTTIHDSIAVLAGSVRSKLLPAIRDTYYEMATGKIFENIVEQLGFDIKVPYTGDLDVELIKKSLYLYS